MVCPNILNAKVSALMVNANSVDPDQTAPSAWSAPPLFAIPLSNCIKANFAKKAEYQSIKCSKF